MSAVLHDGGRKDDHGTIGIIGAMDEEVDYVVSQIEGACTETVAGSDYVLGTVNGRHVAVVQCDMGKVNAALAAATLICHFNVEIILNTGVSG